MSDGLDGGGETLHSQIFRAVGRPGPAHQELWQMIEDLIDQRVQEAMPQLAEVRGNDGGAVRVRMDDEDADREFGFARKHGQRYKQGDRVLVQKLRGGDHVVLGTFSDKQGAGQRAVGDDDMEDGAIDRRAIKGNAIGRNEIAGGSIEKNHMTPNSVGSEELMGNSVDKGHLKNNAVGSSQLEGNAVQSGHLSNDARNSLPTKAEVNAKADKSELNNKADKSDLNNKADKSDLTSYVKASELAPGAKGSKKLATEEWVSANFEKKKS